MEYQPLFDLGAADPLRAGPVAVEALCRWRHPQLGLVGPDRFIPAAEEAGLMAQLDGEVIARAAAQVGAWQHDGHTTLGLSVNASPSHLDARFVDLVTDAVRDTELRPGTLVVEVTETPAPQLLPAVVAALPRMREVGIGVSIDDYGIGDTTVEMLDGLPIDEVKVDRSLTQASDAGARRKVRALTDSAAIHGWRVVAEGIETTADLTRARERGCDRGQGFLWSRPMSALAFGALLAGAA